MQLTPIAVPVEGSSTDATFVPIRTVAMVTSSMLARRTFAPNIWPTEIGGFAATMTAYYHAMTGLAQKLMRLFALALIQEPTISGVLFRSAAPRIHADLLKLGDIAQFPTSRAQATRFLRSRLSSTKSLHQHSFGDGRGAIRTHCKHRERCHRNVNAAFRSSRD
jgi:hypothetical protein